MCVCVCACGVAWYVDGNAPVKLFSDGTKEPGKCEDGGNGFIVAHFNDDPEVFVTDLPVSLLEEDGSLARFTPLPSHQDKTRRQAPRRSQPKQKSAMKSATKTAMKSAAKRSAYLDQF